MQWNTKGAIYSYPEPVKKKMKFNLTPKQKRAYDFIASYIEKEGVCPSYDEIMDYLGLKSKSNVNRIVKTLKERGWIDYIPNKARSLTLL
ncbi:MAG: helix-turn-helix domain-containing protein [Betaproteobacteria bacterium]|nr:helix-turn-helix domain-containing protein [Betaproteobacteria bacterium]